MVGDPAASSRAVDELIEQIRALVKDAYQLEPEDGPTGRLYALRATYEEWVSLLALLNNKPSEEGR